MFGGSEWLFSAGAALGGTMGQQAKERRIRAVVITEPGESEVVQWLDVPDPSPGPGEVVIGRSQLTPWSEAAGRGDRLGG